MVAKRLQPRAAARRQQESGSRDVQAHKMLFAVTVLPLLQVTTFIAEIMNGFLSRLFNRGARQQPASFGGSQQGRAAGGMLQRATTAPETVVPRRSSSSDDDDVPGIEITYTRRAACGEEHAPVPRRAGAELRRSQTFSAAGADQGFLSVCAARQSLSSSCDGSLDDQLRQLYGKVKPCHRGKSALILEGTDRHTKKRVIIKAFSKLNMSASKRDKMDRELAVLQLAAGSCGIVRILNTLEDVMHKYLVLESVAGCTLIELMANNGGRLPEARCVIEVVHPLLQALATLHNLGVVHRDIKPEHIMCAHGTVKLVDFCESAQRTQQYLNHRVGQLEYMAPEVLSKPTAEEIFHQVLHSGMSETELPQYNEKADVWSAGAVIYEALTGLQPFMVETREELHQAHERLTTQTGPDGLPKLLDHPQLSAGAREFLSDALQVDPDLRPSAEQLLEHPWVVKHTSSMQHTQWLLPPARTPLPTIPSSGTLPPIPTNLKLTSEITGAKHKTSLEHLLVSAAPVHVPVR